MAKDKRDIILEYQQWCNRCCYAEVMSTASWFAELYLNKETKINGQRIAKLYAYVEERNRMS